MNVRSITISVLIGRFWSIATSNSSVDELNDSSPAMASSIPADTVGSSSTSCSWKPWTWDANSAAPASTRSRSARVVSRSSRVELQLGEQQHDQHEREREQGDERAEHGGQVALHP